jgi:hypothetical protein
MVLALRQHAARPHARVIQLPNAVEMSKLASHPQHETLATPYAAALTATVTQTQTQVPEALA